MCNRLKICPNDRRMEGIADIYVIYFQASLFPLTLAPAPQQGQLTVSTSYMNVTLRHKSVDISAPRLASHAGVFRGARILPSVHCITLAKERKEAKR